MRNFSQAPNFRSDLKEFGPHGSEGAMADKDTGWEPDPADVERRKKELLADARGERTGDGPNAMVGLGLQFVVTVLVCLFAGQWLDRRLGTTPWLLLAGVLLGGALGMWTMLRVAKEQEKRQGGK